MPVASSALAVKYLLAMEDQLTPALGKAEKSYTRFTKSIDRLNARTEKSISRTFGKLTSMVSSFTTSVDKAGKSGQSGAGKRGGLADQIAKGVAQALKGVKIRLTASLPAKKNAKFDSSVNLTRMYKNMPQPPDLVGMLEASRAPKFAKGGMVPGQTGGRKDRVPALLTPGEFVLPRDVVDALQPRGGKGRFMSKAQMNAVFSPLIQAATPKGALSKFTAGMHTLWQYAGRIRKVMPAATTTVNGFLKSIRNSAAFLAIHTALQSLKEDFLSIKAASDEISGSLGLDKAADSLVTNFQQMQREFGQSRAEMLKFRDDFMGATASMRYATGDVSEATETLQGLMRQGVGEAMAIDLVKGAHLAAQSMGVAREAVAQFSATASRDLKLTGSQLEDTYATLRNVANVSGTSSDAIIRAVQATMEGNRALFEGMSSTQAQKALESLGRLSAVSEKVIGAGTGEEMAQMFAKAANLDEGSMMAVAAATGESVDALRARLTSGDFEGFFKTLRVGGGGALRIFAEKTQMSEGLAKALQERTGELNTELQSTAKVTVAAGTGAKVMDDAYWDSLTTFQKLSETVGGYVKREFADFLEVLKDVNITGLASMAYLATTAGPPLLQMGRWVKTNTRLLLHNVAASKLWTAAQSRMAGGIKPAGMLGKIAGRGGLIASLFGSPLALKSIVKAITQIASKFLGLLGPIGLIVSAVVTIGMFLWDYIVEAVDAASAAFGEWWGYITAALAPIGDAFAELGKAWDSVFGGDGEKVQWLSATFKFLGGVVGKALGGALWVVAGVIGAVVSGIVKGITAIVELVGLVKDAAPLAWNMLKSWGASFVDFFTGLPAMIGNAIGDLANWLVGKLTAAIPDWVFTALNYAGIISDDELSGIQASRNVAAVGASAIQGVQSAPATTGPAADNGALLSAVNEMNAHLRDINDNTAEGTSVVVKNIMPRSPSVLNGMIAAGGV